MAPAKKVICAVPSCGRECRKPLMRARKRCHKHPCVATPTAASRGPVLPAPVLSAAVSSIAAGRLAFPSTEKGWLATTDVLRGRLAELAPSPLPPLAVPGGELAMELAFGREPGGAEVGLPFHGTLVVGGVEYFASGARPGSGGLVVRTLDGQRVPTDVLHAVSVAVGDAWEADEEHAELRDLHDAFRACAWMWYDYDNVSEYRPRPGLHPALRGTADRARRALALLVTRDLPEPARKVALTLVDHGYCGDAEELCDAASATVVERPGR